MTNFPQKIATNAQNRDLPTLCVLCVLLWQKWHSSQSKIKNPKSKILPCLLLLLALLSRPCPAADSPYDGLGEARLENLTLRYSPEADKVAGPLGRYLDKLMPQFGEYLRDNLRKAGADAVGHETEDVTWIARELALPGSTPRMTEVYRHFSRQWYESLGALLDFHRAVIWTDTDLDRRVRAGEPTPGAAWDPARRAWRPSWFFHVQGHVEGQKQTLDFLPASPGATLEFVPTLIFTANELKDSVTAVSQGRGMIRLILGQVTDPAGPQNLFAAQMLTMTCHETAESALVENRVSGPGRRWIAEGLATWLGLRRVGDRLGPEMSDRSWQLSHNPAAMNRELPRVDLLGWPSVEDETATAPKGDLLLAHYYLATEIIREAARRHGDDVFRQTFAALPSAAPDAPGKRDSPETFLRVFQKITGTDLRSYIEPVRQQLLAGPPTPAAAPAAPGP